MIDPGQDVHCGKSTTSRSTGFSLLELMVVLSVIAIVIGLLLPAVTSSRRSAKIVGCASNLRQIGQALQAYKADYKNWPAARLMPLPFADSPEDAVYSPLYSVLVRYLVQNSPLYRCPADNGQVYDRCAAVSPAGLGMSYLCSFAWPVYLRGREHIMWDYNGLNDEYGHFPLFHQNGVNELALDGSVEFVLQRKP